MPNVMRVWYKGDVPIAKSVWANVRDGVVDSLELDTLGVRSQSYTLSLLKEKFGDPESFEEVRRLRIFGQRDKLKANRSKRGVRGGHKEETAQRRIQGARGDDGAFRGEDPG